MLGYAFIIFVQIYNLIWRNVIVYLDLITTSPYLFCVHLNYQHKEVSFNWILLSDHFKVRDMYSIPRNEAMWKQTLLSCSLPAEQGLPAIQKRNPEFHQQSIQQWQKRTLSAPWESNKGQSPALLLPIFLSMLTPTFYFTPGRCFWCPSPSFLPSPSFDASQICLGECWILLAWN